MATAMNCTVKVYRGVPLIKGGTEVLYLAQGAAEGVLGAYLAKTYTQYYYTREFENYIQVEDTIASLEGCNYVSFQNLSHGGKLFFGFIDHLEYVNDNNTAIVFTIDPFPTYMGDCTERQDVFVIRNTVKTDSLDYIAEDFDFEGRKLVDYNITSKSLALSKTITIFTGGRLTSDDGSITLADTSSISGAAELFLYGYGTGIQYKVGMTPADIRVVNQAGGSIIGTYAVDSSFDPANLASEQLAGAVIFPAVGHLKLNTGQYNKIVIDAAGNSKVYDLNRFSGAPRVTFMLRRIICPVPYLAIIPENYKGFAENTSEALVIQYPSLAFAVGNTYNMSSVVNSSFDSFITSMSKSTTFNEVAGEPDRYEDKINKGIGDYPKLANAANKVVSGLRYLGAGFGALPDIIANAKRAVGTARKGTDAAEITSSAGSLVLAAGNTIEINVRNIRHDPADIQLLDDYFEYYGYELNRFTTPNTDDKAYLQTGSEFLSGSEQDVLLNQYLMRGIKIKKTLP